MTQGASRFRRDRWRGLAHQARGFSVTEAMTILTATSILTGALAPAMDDYLARAKAVRATHDVRVLGVAIVRVMADTSAERLVDRGWATYDLLVGAGGAPAASRRDALEWTLDIGARVGTLDSHLVRWNHAYTRRTASSPFGWRGPYLQEAVGPDPWGHRYATNVSAARSEATSMVVLSAGANGTVDSLLEPDGLPVPSDDYVALVATAGSR